MKRSKENRKMQSLEERFRQLRTNIEFSQYDKNLRVINVVSTFPNEGKTTVALNLAKAYAAQYKNILLIDCDLRNPSVHKNLKISNQEGLSNLLFDFKPGENLLERDEIRSVSYQNDDKFYVLTTGQKVPNPQEMLSSRRFKNLIDEIRRQFSMIIIDCTPCLAVADAIPVCNVSDGSLYVISARDTDKRAVREGFNELKRNGANIIGTVLTKAESRNRGGYYYYDYEYSYGSNKG